MIKITFKELNSQAFNQALKYLSSQNGFSNFQEAYNMTKIVRQYHEQQKIAHEMFLKFAKDYCEVDEKGNLVIAPPEAPKHPFCPWAFKEGKQAEFDEKITEFFKTEATIEARALKPEALGNIDLSPNQIITLEPIFSVAEQQQEPSQH